jgi:hypothetical protein
MRQALLIMDCSLGQLREKWLHTGKRVRHIMTMHTTLKISSSSSFLNHQDQLGPMQGEVLQVLLPSTLGDAHILLAVQRTATLARRKCTAWHHGIEIHLNLPRIMAGLGDIIAMISSCSCLSRRQIIG